MTCGCVTPPANYGKRYITVKLLPMCNVCIKCSKLHDWVCSITQRVIEIKSYAQHCRVQHHKPHAPIHTCGVEI